MIRACRPIVLLFIAVLMSGGPAVAQESSADFKFRFVFISDTRGDYKINKSAYLADQMIPRFTKQILSLKPRPALLFFNGDMLAKTAYRESPGSPKRWRELFLAPLQKENIPVYVAPGNHIVEFNRNETRGSLRYVRVFNDLFATPGTPKNGPKGYEGVTYSLTLQNCQFLTAVPFTTHDGFDNTEIPKEEFVHAGQGYEYYMNRTNRDWLADQLEKSSSPFKIVFFHVPLYPVGPHYEDKKGFHSHPKNRDEVARLLVRNKVDILFASHEHLYARAVITASNPAGEKPCPGRLLQVITGSAGSPLEHKLKRTDMTFEKYVVSYNFLVGDVYGDKIECTVYDEKGTPIDAFTIKKGR